MRTHAQRTRSLPIVLLAMIGLAGTAAAATTAHHVRGTKSPTKGTRAACEAVAAAYEQRVLADVDAGESDPFTPTELANMHTTVVTNCLKQGINSSYVHTLESQ